MIPASIPILQLTPNSNEVSAQIEQACRSTGFFYLSLPADSNLLSQAEQAFAQAGAFFALPTAVKLQIERSAQTNCGYVATGTEALNSSRVGDSKEALNLGLANLGDASVWTDDLRPFQASLAPFYHACIQQVALPLLRSLALSLALPAAFFVERHQQNFFLRLLHYPPLAATQTQTSAIRAGEHTDYGTMTLLFQAGQGGLEIFSGGSWRPVLARPELILVNLGDAIQRWTNDRYRSTPHRVVAAEAAQSSSRYSMALFCDPDPAVEIACLPSCDSPARYAPIRYQDYLQSRFAATYTSSDVPLLR
ncbi:MAG: isopenicillin N synthase family oxygenase [Pegethrix bostrychoides GSE-TBD4-15B]|jgi:isopenicillin N synthase-like dioxygenase|uniref:Isopenicillin N synthase family oxygenase n=1 Tax=Pegethrix bostrychoides GSE-TBD4-15B TaxID=2839662 RepID=A0A951P8E0_9CYAN|nr:isopenicillin N synthase family oxygenase [Pegethrix bostrychoides GSE-TBD4-15B]